MISDKELLHWARETNSIFSDGIDQWHTKEGKELLKSWKLRIDDIHKQVNERLIENK